MKKRIFSIITASVLILALCSFIGIQAYQYYAPHSYIFSNKTFHDPDCRAINYADMKVYNEQDYFKDSFVSNPVQRCPLCNPKDPSISGIREAYKQWKQLYETTAPKVKENESLYNAIQEAKKEAVAMPLTNLEFSRLYPDDYFGRLAAESEPHEQASSYDKEEHYLLQFLQKKGYSYETLGEVYRIERQIEGEKYNENYYLSATTVAENYIRERKNIFYFFHK